MSGSAFLRPPGRVARITSWFRRNAPWVLLVALSIALPELLTGSTPMFNLLNPIAILGLLGLYGAGVLLVREATIVWRKGWGTTLLLGAAYGIVEEGLAVKTFFNTDPKVTGYLATYGHAAGVNFVWASEMIVFHAIFSIGLPILLVWLAFPARRNERFLTPRGVRWVVAAYVATVAFMAVVFVPSAFPGPILYVATFLAAVAFAVAGWLLPANALPSAPFGPPRHSPLGFFGLGATFTFGFFGICWLLVQVLPFPALVILSMGVLAVGLGEFARRRFGNPASLECVTAFAFGLVLFLVVFSEFAALLGDVVVLGVTALTLLFLAQLYGDRKRDSARFANDQPSARPRAVG